MSFSGNIRHAGGWVNQTNWHCGREGKEYLQQVLRYLSKHLWADFDWFSFYRMDENNDGTLTEEEFLKGCLLVTNRKIFTFITSSFPVSYQINNTIHAWSLLKISRQLTFLTITIPMITRTTSSPKCCVQMCLRSRCQTQLNTFLVWTLFFFYCCPSSDIYLPCLISIHHSVRVLLTLTMARKSKILGNRRNP